MGAREHDVLGELELSARSASQDAPFYQIPSRVVSAVEHPMVVLDSDKAMKTFGSSFNFHTILDHESAQLSVPLYLRYDNPVVRPIISHNAASHNVLLRIDVPRRTGRKRKRGSDGPWQEPDEASLDALRESQRLQIHSQKRLDSPSSLRRKLRDNVGRYEVEAVGLIRNTHRYRGLADFQYSTVNSPFMNQVVDKILPGDVAMLRQFAFRPEVAQPPNVEIIPPPVFSHMSLPFQYGYSQNPYVRTVDGAEKTINVQARVRSAGYFISHNRYPVPDAPSRQPDATDPQMAAVVSELRLAMAERPLWTRRSLTNRIMRAAPFSDNLIKTAIPYVAYQFKAGPWRDAMIPYGLDPRSDPKYRIYQTLSFKTRRADANAASQPWASLRRAEAAAARRAAERVSINPLPVNPDNGEADDVPYDQQHRDTHIFDGNSFYTDGKVWQVCDITDPLLRDLFARAAVRPSCDDAGSGWFHRGLWAKARAVMKCKMLAITFGRVIADADFAGTLAMDDGTPEPTPSAGTIIAGTGNVRHAHVNVPLPDLGLTDAELAVIRGRDQSRFHSSLKKRVRRSHGTQYRIPVLTNSGQEKQKQQQQQPQPQQIQQAGVDGGAAASGVAGQTPSLTVTSPTMATTKLTSGVVRFEDTPLRSVEDVINQDDDDEDDDEDEIEDEEEGEGEGEGDDLDGEEDEDDDEEGEDEDDLAEDTYYEDGGIANETEVSAGPKAVPVQRQNGPQLTGLISGRDGDDGGESEGEDFDDENDIYDDEDEDGYSNDDGAVFGGEFANSYEEEGGFSSAEEY
ncbi:hypothetical protein RB594_000800 [Gaeumannomyces avenae]